MPEEFLEQLEASLSGSGEQQQQTEKVMKKGRDHEALESLLILNVKVDKGSTPQKKIE